LTEADRQEAVTEAFRFAQRFTKRDYDRPWGSFFLLPPADSVEMPSVRALSIDFQRGYALSTLFSEAERWATPEEVVATFEKEIANGEWRDRATRRANDELLLAMASERETRRIPALTSRELRILEVIKRGARGLQYCRELDACGVGPLRTGVWKDCPRKYESAYKEGHSWRHRIQDEKFKIQRKARLAETRKLASE